MRGAAEEPGGERSDAGGPWPRHRSPRELRLRDWRGVVVRLVRSIGAQNLSLVAAGCAFYGVLALVPSLAALVFLYGLVADPVQVQQEVESAAGVLPHDLVSLLAGELTGMASASPTGLTSGLVATLAVALWYASAAIQSLIVALNIALNEEEKRGFFGLHLVGLVFTVLGMLALVVALATIVGVPAVLAFVGLDDDVDWLVRMLRWPILAVFVMGGLALLYRFGPSRANPRWQWISIGAVLATGIWLIASAGFSLYVSSFGTFNATFGSMGAVIVVLFWFYISMFVIILGAKLNGEIEHATAVDTTTGRPRPMGERGAYYADHVAPDG